MARKEQNFNSATDLPEIDVAGPGFADIPVPPQQLINQEVAAQPKTDEVIALGRPPRKTRSSSATSAQSGQYVRRTAQQIIDGFLAEISGHPDFAMLTSAIGGRPEKSTEFPNTPHLNQHKAELRFIWRDPIQDVPRVNKEIPSAYAPGGKYYDLIPKKGEAEPSEPANDGPRPWENIVKKRELEAVAT